MHKSNVIISLHILGVVHACENSNGDILRNYRCMIDVPRSIEAPPLDSGFAGGRGQERVVCHAR